MACSGENCSMSYINSRMEQPSARLSCAPTLISLHSRNFFDIINDGQKSWRNRASFLPTEKRGLSEYESTQWVRFETNTVILGPIEPNPVGSAEGAIFAVQRSNATVYRIRLGFISVSSQNFTNNRKPRHEFSHRERTIATWSICLFWLSHYRKITLNCCCIGTWWSL